MTILRGEIMNRYQVEASKADLADLVAALKKQKDQLDQAIANLRRYDVASLPAATEAIQ